MEVGPSLGYEDEVTPAFERRVRIHYRLETSHSAEDRAGYGAYYRDHAELRETGDADPEAHLHGHESDPEDEIRVRRSEEEIRVETREAGAMRVRKRLRTDRERVAVPKKRIEVTVERVPVEGEALPAGEEATTTPEIREDEIVVPVVKEEIRIRKEIVEDVRREEVEIDDQTDRNPEPHADQDEELESNER